jgi:hypothetical protein
MPRDVVDADGIAWSCVQAPAGLGKDAAEAEAARVEGAPGLVHVACTPGGGARSVRPELSADWEEACKDAEILDAIRVHPG